jgi:hypothetical protein
MSEDNQSILQGKCIPFSLLGSIYLKKLLRKNNLNKNFKVKVKRYQVCDGNEYKSPYHYYIEVKSKNNEFYIDNVLETYTTPESYWNDSEGYWYDWNEKGKTENISVTDGAKELKENWKNFCKIKINCIKEEIDIFFEYLKNNN